MLIAISCTSNPDDATETTASESSGDIVVYGACGPVHDNVVRVLDGDTVEISSGYKVRFLLVDTPEVAHNSGEVAECYGEAARKYTSSRILGEWIDLEYDEVCIDKYDRLLAYVILDDGAETLNETLVSRGFATVMFIPPNGASRVDAYYALEDEAQIRGLGGHGSCVSFNQ